MKANEAPEKIYISTNSKDGTYYISNQYKRLIEYTCTEAFIEKARKWFEMKPETYDANGVRVYGDEDFEDFVKFIKGEEE